MALDREPASVDLREADDFTSLKVVISGGRDATALATALKPLGTIDADHASLAIQALKRLAGPRGADPGWASAFAAMITHARAHGWVSEDGRCVRAHCEWT